ncbi:trypsin-like serine peptidase [Baia soyae]|uniref:Serine protease n=1 Tax=Baia soyae TaxID=1544746 RepID=A0A4R2RFZ1_9BACL|nr:trypsin-like peptidase domain-containing protein [Baia soyae]TCP62570.1 V8-like Glu-specific endopeptidase [Baia soyae]
MKRRVVVSVLSAICLSVLPVWGASIVKIEKQMDADIARKNLQEVGWYYKPSEKAQETLKEMEKMDREKYPEQFVDEDRTDGFQAIPTEVLEHIPADALLSIGTDGIHVRESELKRIPPDILKKIPKKSLHVVTEEEWKKLKDFKPEIYKDDGDKTHSMVTPSFKTEGVNNLNRVSNTLSSPHNAVAHLTITHANGDKGQCTGFYIDFNTILTASHCVWNLDETNPKKRLAKNVTIRRAMNGPVVQPYPAVTTSAFWVNSNFMEIDTSEKIPKSVSQHDFAAIQSPSRSNAWFNVRNWSHAEGEQALSEGYPGESRQFDGKYPYNSLGILNNLYNQYFKVSSYVEGGMSGGPMWNSKSGYTATIGLNSMGNNGDNGAWSPRFVGANYEKVVYWMNL